MQDIPSPPPGRKTHSDTAWKIVLALLVACQILALGVFVARIFWRLESSWLNSQALALISILGLLLWCVDSVRARPELTKFALRCILLSFLAWVAAFFLMPFKDTSKLREKQKAEATQHFHALVGEGKLPVPFPADNLEIGGRHGALSFHYKDASGDEHIYFARRTSEWVWVFENPLERKKVKARAEE